MKAEEIARLLGLQPHPEGGFYRETYLSDLKVPDLKAPDLKVPDLKAPDLKMPGQPKQLEDASRALATAIYYLLTPETFSEIHRLDADEIWHHYQGDPVEQLQLRDDGEDQGGVVILGQDLAQEQRPQILVPRGVWQGSRVLPGEFGYALCGTTMAPGFLFEGFEAAERADLTRRFPQHRELIAAMTRH